MSAVPYILLAVPIADLAMSHSDAGDLMLSLWLLIIAWRKGWMRW